MTYRDQVQLAELCAGVSPLSQAVVVAALLRVLMQQEGRLDGCCNTVTARRD
jgi:hypothetical protein